MSSPWVVPGATLPGASLFTPGSSCWRYARAWWVILRPAGVDGRISTARTQRGSVRGICVSGLNHTSCPWAGMV